MAKKTIYYSSYNEDVIKNKKQEIKINKGFKWIHTNLLYKICSRILYCIAWVFSYFYCKFALHLKVENKEILKEYKNVGYFIYGNHTLPMGDAFNPAMICQKRFYTIAEEANLGVPVIGKLLPILGALIIPENISDTKLFMEAIETRLKRKKAIVVYPEAHVWPYYTKIRPFDETAFKFPMKYDVPSFCMTTTYQKRKNSSKPKVTVYIDGPFYVDKNLSKSEQKQNLCNKIKMTMEERSKLSSYEYYKYEERK